MCGPHTLEERDTELECEDGECDGVWDGGVVDVEEEKWEDGKG